jgi:hypothetical protein
MLIVAADAQRASPHSELTSASPLEHRRPAKAGLLRERLKGLEPSTFCMAIGPTPTTDEIAANKAFYGHPRSTETAQMPLDSRGFSERKRNATGRAQQVCGSRRREASAHDAEARGVRRAGTDSITTDENEEIAPGSSSSSTTWMPREVDGVHAGAPIPLTDSRAWGITPSRGRYVIDYVAHPRRCSRLPPSRGDRPPLRSPRR